MTGKSPLFTLNNGVQMPALGLGVYQSGSDETVAAVVTALAEGYRMIDTAAAYGNEAEVGQGIVQSGIDRSEVFVTTKLWISDYGYDSTLHAFDRSLRKLGLDYLDLYLLHWPMPTDFDATVASWKAAEKLLADGRVRAIGVSNFSAQHLDDLLAQVDVIPAINQVELHPFFVQQELQDADARRGIITQAWSPIGGVKRYWNTDNCDVQDPLVHPIILDLATKYSRTPAQIILRWHIELGISAIPKSVKASRISENIDIFDFSLSGEEVKAITALDTSTRGGPEPEEVNTELFSFKIED
ncbi:aldo/keto reductase [Pectobacterium brasiliense]|uniref:aldo/keto reductase n=1 Tax=Pectobacterium brasiliense TaxID=180957 RepID=UPI0015DE2FF5|nr:aldo/keto reductase [Pectobacterium brasiliense]MBA0207734.1 aldo/keto reductase [Pectobacterium brasiliense]